MGTLLTTTGSLILGRQQCIFVTTVRWCQPFRLNINMLQLVSVLILAALANAFHANFNGTRPEKLRKSYDFIIVGGGAAGCRVAERLSSNSSFRVLLIEAGGVPPESSKIPLLATWTYGNAKYDWSYKTAPQETSMQASPDLTRTISAGRVLGGGSSINLMAYQRGNRDDYDNWETKHGAKGWNFNEVLKLFKETENSNDLLLSDEYHGRSGPLEVTTYREPHPVKDALHRASHEELGLEYSDQNDGNHWGYYHMMSTTKRGRRVSSFNAFLEPILGRPNLDVLLHSHVTKVLIENGRAVGVAFIRDELPGVARASREVILSAGALRTPQLLMLSGIGNREHLKQHKIPLVHHLPGVGQNLQDHYGFLGLIAEIPDEGIPDLNDTDGLQQWFLHQTGPFTYPSGIQMGVMYVATGEDRTRPDAEIIPIAARNMQFETNLKWEVAADFYGPLAGKSTLHITCIIQRPESRGEVRLASADGTAAPIIDPKYFSDSRDVETAVKVGRQVIQLLRSDTVRAANVSLYERPFPSCAHAELFSDDYLRCLAVSHSFEIFHPSCTCKMGGDNDPLAVLDERLRVRGVQGLRVVDTSAMPAITVGHLNAPAIMIGSMAGKFILEDHDAAAACQERDILKQPPMERQEL